MNVTIPEVKFHHAIPVQLRFSDVDRFGHINNAIYFQIYDLAKTEYLHTVLPEAFELQKDAVPVIANINADFLSSVYYGDPIEALTAVTHIGTKSFTLYQCLRNKETGVIHCQCTTVMVYISIKEKQATALPENIRKAFEAFEKGDEI